MWIIGGENMPTLRKNVEQQRETAIKIALTTARLEKGWSVGHLANLLGMKTPQVSVIINHPLQRELQTLLKVSDKLGVDLLNI